MNTSTSSFSRPLRGIVPPMVTPLRARDELDSAGLERLVEHILGGGVTGLFILGTTGEGPSLSYRLRREFIRRTCALVGERVPVLVGITDTSFQETVQMARHAADAGARAVVASAPYYFPAGQPELVEYLEHLVRELPLPLFLYNMPSLTKVSFDIDTVRRLADIENIVGIKDSSGDMSYFHQLLQSCRHRSDWTFLIGPEMLTADAVLAGGHGGVNGGANVHPGLFMDLYRAAEAADIAAVRRLQADVASLGALYRIGRHASAIIKGIKCALRLMGICDDFMAEPFHCFRDAERAKVRRILEEMGLLSEQG